VRTEASVETGYNADRDAALGKSFGTFGVRDRKVVRNIIERGSAALNMPPPAVTLLPNHDGLVERGQGFNVCAASYSLKRHRIYVYEHGFYRLTLAHELAHAVQGRRFGGPTNEHGGVFIQSYVDVARAVWPLSDIADRIAAAFGAPRRGAEGHRGQG
jgi:hypothetical protein